MLSARDFPGYVVEDQRVAPSHNARPETARIGMAGIGANFRNG